MVFTNGVVQVFADKAIVDEVVFNGNGTTNTFNVNVPTSPLYIDTFTIKYIIGSTEYTGTADSAGNITGTNITSGTITESGVLNITFSTAPDNSTTGRASHTAKGLMTKVIEFVKGTENTENLGSGDSSTTVFSGTLTNTPVEGQNRLIFTIGSVTYKVYDDGQGKFTHQHLTDGNINYTTKAWDLDFSTPPDTGTNNIQLEVISGSPGQDWKVVLEENSKDNGTSSPSDAFPGTLLKQWIIKNSGNDYTRNITVGFREFQYTPTFFYGINTNQYNQGYTDGSHWNSASLGLGHNVTSYNGTSFNNHPSMITNDNTINYWVYSNKNRIIIAYKTGTVYDHAYLGMGLAFANQTQYRLALINATSRAGHIAFTDTSGFSQMFVKSDAFSGCKAMVNDIDDRPHSNNGVGGSTLNDIRFYPSYNNSDMSNLKQTTNGKTLTHPFFAANIGTTTGRTLCMLEGLYAVIGSHFVSEDTLTDATSGKTLRVFQDVHRQTNFDYLAIEEA